MKLNHSVRKTAGLLLLISVSLAGAPVYATTAVLPDSVSKVLQRFKLDGSGLSVLVKEVDSGAIRLTHKADTPRNPASTIKLFTSLVALEQLTPAYQWTTPVYADGEIKNGVLQGDLWIQGSGDPFLPLERMWLLVHQLENTGLTTINGDIFIDQSAFAPINEDPSAFDGQGLRAYNVVPAALISNFNVSRFIFRQGSGGKVDVQAVPDLPGLKIDNRLRTAKGACRGYNRGIAMNLGPQNELILDGKFPAGCPIYSMSRSVMENNQYTAELFRQLWQQSGNTWSGRQRSGEREFTEEPLLAFKSVYLGEAIRSINKYSNNVMTRMLFLTLGMDAYDKPATVEKSRLAINKWLQSKKLSVDRLTIENGAGSSRRARATANHFGDLLSAAWESPYMPEFVASMSVTGEDGTFARRHRGGALKGRAHLKSGRLDDVVGMAGYVQARNNKRYIVVTLHNADEVHRGAGHAVQDALLKWVYEQP